MTTVLLIRHGRTAANTSGILAGRASVSSSTTSGSSRRPKPEPGWALCRYAPSSHRRCVAAGEPAQALQAARTDSCPILVDQALVECGYGDWTGRSLRELSKEKLWQSVQHQPSAVRFPGGESMTEMSSRAVSAIRGWDRRLATEHGADAIWAAVSHSDVIKAILADALGMHLDSFQRLLVDPGSVSVVRYTSSPAVRGHRKFDDR